MGKYSTKQAAGAQEIKTLGGDYALKWDDETQMSVNAHAALLSQFAKSGGFFDRLVETCPMRLKSNNAPDVRDLIATVMVSMINGATRFRHFDRLHGDGATAKLWNVFTRLGDDGMHHEAVTTRPLLQSCIARLSHHARRGIVTIYTAMSEKARKIYRAISEFLSNVSSASQLGIEERRQRIIAHAFREYGIIRRLFPPDIGGQMTIPLA